MTTRIWSSYLHERYYRNGIGSTVTVTLLKDSVGQWWMTADLPGRSLNVDRKYYNLHDAQNAFENYGDTLDEDLGMQLVSSPWEDLATWRNDYWTFVVQHLASLGGTTHSYRIVSLSSEADWGLLPSRFGSKREVDTYLAESRARYVTPGYFPGTLEYEAVPPVVEPAVSNHEFFKDHPRYGLF